MAVYVDDMKAPWGRMIMSHMIADTPEELREMADRIGVPIKWIEREGTAREHLDVCQSKRRKAVRLGAIEITRREAARIVRRRAGDERIHL